MPEHGEEDLPALVPLDVEEVTAVNEAKLDERGNITCPWHGYRFDVATGQNIDGKCNDLAQTPRLIERNGKLYFD